MSDLHGALTTLDICVDHAWPFISGSDIFKRTLIDMNRKAKLRIITEITKDNIYSCKELLNLGELRHLDGIKGNFAVSEKEYIAYGTMQHSSLLQQVIHSNVKEIVEQQRYEFLE